MSSLTPGLSMTESIKESNLLQPLLCTAVKGVSPALLFVLVLVPPALPSLALELSRMFDIREAQKMCTKLEKQQTQGGL